MGYYLLFLALNLHFSHLTDQEVQVIDKGDDSSSGTASGQSRRRQRT